MKPRKTNLNELKRYEIKKKGKIESFLLTKNQAINKGFCAMCDKYIDKDAIAKSPYAFPYMCVDCSEKFYYLITVFGKDKKDVEFPLSGIIANSEKINDF